jgi:ABC-type multidrug transport system ATPase subunit
VLLLDEPTTGVDPLSRSELWEMLGRLATQGITIVASTPYMNEAAMCDRIAIVRDGEIAREVGPEEIRGAYPEAFA